MKNAFQEGGTSFLKKLGREAIETAVETLVEEGVEAAVEIWKERRMKIQEEYFEERDAEEDRPDISANDRRSYPSDDVSGEPNSDDEPSAEKDEDEPDDEPASPADAYDHRRRGVESFADYAERQSSD